MQRLSAAALALAALSGCATAPQAPAPTVIPAQFDEAEARAMMAPGNSTIKGSALIRQRGGGVVTCAGGVVTLLPQTLYAKQRMARIYQGATLSRANVEFADEPPSYRLHTRQTRCDAQGNFSFDRVKEGSYFVTTLIVWTVASSRQGGSVHAPVHVSGPGVTEVVISP